MSLPHAKKDISEHPAKDAVTSPADKDLLERDVNRKFRLFGAIEAFRHGRLPANKQLDDGLQYVQGHSPVDIDQISPEGQRLIQDTRDIINTTRIILREKNADELLQNFIWHTRDIDRDAIAPGDAMQHLPVDRETARSDSQQAARHLRTLLHIVLTNSEARKLLSDFSVIGRDLLSKAASEAAEAMAPSEEALRQADEAGAENEFITEGGQRVGPDTTPVLEARLPGTESTVRRHPGDDETYVHPQEGEQRPLGDVQQEGMSRARDLAGEGRRVGEGATKEARSRARDHVEDICASDAPEQQAQAKKAGFMERVKDVTQNLTDRVPSQHKDRAQEQYDRGRRFLAEEYFPEERREQFIFRGKKVVLECQKHEDYQTSIRWLLDYIEHYAKHGRQITDNQSTSVFTDPHVSLSLREVRTLLERFANNTSLDGVIDAANVLIDDSKRDPQLRRWFKDVDTYIRRILLQAGYVLDESCNQRGNELRETGRQFYDDKYRTQFDDLFGSVSSWFKAMGEDPLNKQFGEDWARLTKNLLFDSEGSLKFKPELWNDIRKVILPQFIEKVGYIPIPRIEYTDDNLDLVVENLALRGSNLFPNIISLEANNYIKFSPYNAIADDNRHHITLHLEQMQADMRDVAFYYRMKGGIKMTDSGLADVLLGGRGLSGTIALRSATRDKSSVFKVDSVHVKVDSLKFSIRDAKHSFLYKTIKPLATGLVKKQIEKAVRDALTTGLEYIDGQLVAVRDRMETAKQTEGQKRTDVLKELFHHKKDEVKSRDEKEKSSQFKIVANKRDSILAPVGHPRGWVNMTEEREKAAVHGTEWRSEAFDLVERRRDTHAVTGNGAGTGADTRAGTGNGIAVVTGLNTGANGAPATENGRRRALGGTHHASPTAGPGISSGSDSQYARTAGQAAHTNGNAPPSTLLSKNPTEVHTRGHPGHVYPEDREGLEAGMMLSGNRPEVVPVKPEASKSTHGTAAGAPGKQQQQQQQQQQPTTNRPMHVN